MLYIKYLYLITIFTLNYFYLMIRPPTRYTLFPYTTLFRSQHLRERPDAGLAEPDEADGARARALRARPRRLRSEEQRLNSSHTVISYAVFCLKKKIKSKKKHSYS